MKMSCSIILPVRGEFLCEVKKTRSLAVLEMTDYVSCTLDNIERSNEKRRRNYLRGVLMQAFIGPDARHDCATRRATADGYSILHDGKSHATDQFFLTLMADCIFVHARNVATVNVLKPGILPICHARKRDCRGVGSTSVIL